MSGETIVSRGEAYKKNKELVIKSSRKLYGRKYMETKKVEEDNKDINKVVGVDV